MSADIIIFPRSPESAGAMVRRFGELGYALSNRHGRVVARPLPVRVDEVVTPLHATRDAAFSWLDLEGRN